MNLFMEDNPHAYAFRVYSGSLRIDSVKLPSGKTYQLCSVPYYLLSRLQHVIEWFVSGRVNPSRSIP